MTLQRYKIDNTQKSAVDTKWNPDKSSLVEKIKNSSIPKKLMQEMFLQYPDNPDQMTGSNVKYPHHTLVDGKCVLNCKGVQAAYARLKQQGKYSGEMKEHIDRHRKELGQMQKEEKLESILSDLDKSYDALVNAMAMAENVKNTAGKNLFQLMMEKPTINPAPNGAAIPDNTAQADPNAGQQQPTQQSTSPNYVDQTATIPVTNVNPTEDTSTNNPVEGPDDRDQNNLDGNGRKEMYQNFANVMIQANKSCVFGTIFDQDIFKSEYKIVPYEMRYFYRLQNPVSVELDDFRFIPFGTELLEAQDKYDLGKKMFVFATKADKPIFFNQLDKTIWFNDDKLADTFDGLIESMAQNNGSLPEISEEGQQNQDANVQYAPDQTGEQPAPDQTANPADANTAQPNAVAPTDGPAPVDLSAAPAHNQSAGVNTGLAPTPTTPEQAVQATTPQGNEPAPIDLTQQNASVNADDSIADLFESMEQERLIQEAMEMEPVDLTKMDQNEYMTEGVAFPNDALIERERKRKEALKRRMMGEIFFG